MLLDVGLDIQIRAVFQASMPASAGALSEPMHDFGWRRLRGAGVDRGMLLDHAHDHTRARPPLFDELRQYTQDNVPSPQMQVGRVEGTLLKMLAALLGAR